MYYDDIASGYDELHKEEQLAKLAFIAGLGIIKPTDKLLDVGCGTGFSLDYFEVREAVGIDPAKKLVEQYGGEKKILVGRAEELPFEDGSFDVVISVTAVHNFMDIEKGLREMRRVGNSRFIFSILKGAISKVDNLLASVFKNYDITLLEQEKDIICAVTKH